MQNKIMQKIDIPVYEDGGYKSYDNVEKAVAAYFAGCEVTKKELVEVFGEKAVKNAIARWKYYNE